MSFDPLESTIGGLRCTLKLRKFIDLELLNTIIEGKQAQIFVGSSYVKKFAVGGLMVDSILG